MIQTVLFAQAAKNVVSNTALVNIALDIGPHPALRGSLSKTTDVSPEAHIPYSVCLIGAMGDIKAFHYAISLFCTCLPPSTVNFVVLSA